MSFRSTKSLLLLSLVLVGIALVAARPEKSIVVTLADIHNSEPVKLLNKIKHAVEEEQSPLMRKVFAVLFPFGPAWNSILGTFYISSVPNFILAFIPAQIAPDTLNTMTAFATGGLLSDVFLHLMPHSFLGEGAEHDVSFVMREEKKNVLVGFAVFVGFAAFFFMEKTFRVLGSEDGHSHGGHSHSHAPVESVAVASGTDALTSGNELTARGKSKKNKKSQDSGVPTPSSNIIGPSKTSAFLNLFGDFLHNITDGLAMAASFYASPAIGATTTLACFAHEIPHEIADYSILIRSGLTKKQAMQSQFLTAIGAFIGTFIGIAVHSVGAKEAEAVDIDLVAGITQTASGILGTTLQVGELMIPFVAGGFLYIGAVAVLPTLLAESKSGKQALREFAAMALGVTCMFLVAWNE